MNRKLYLSPIIDLFNGEVVSYNHSRHPDFKRITDMLENAFQKLPDKVDNLILHSDQGWQYQMKTYQRMLKAKGITQSMSRKATCLDNAVVENFFGLLKTELFYLEEIDSVDQLEKLLLSISTITTSPPTTWRRSWTGSSTASPPRTAPN